MSGLSSGWPTKRTRPVLVALVAGGLYGSWAAFAHHRLGAGVALRAGCTQVALSVTSTLVLVLVLERLFRWPPNPVRGFFLAFLGTSMLGTSWLIVGHALAGTPHIALAIAPSVIVGAAFNFAYASALLAVARRDFDNAGAPETARRSRRGAVVSAALDRRAQRRDRSSFTSKGSRHVD